MMPTAGDWIEAAYSRSSANDPGKLATDAELVAQLSRIFARLFALLARARPDETLATLTLALSGVPATSPLSGDLIDIRRIEKADGTKVHLIPSVEKDRAWHIAPSMYRVGTTLYSRNKTGDPVAGEVLTAFLLTQPPPLIDMTSAMDPRFPLRHHQLPIDMLALYLDTKDAGRDAVQHGKLLAEVGAARAAFTSEYGLPPSALEWSHEPSERKPVANAGESGGAA